MPSDDPAGFEASVDLILEECRLALSRVDPRAVDELVDAILAADKVFVVGVGRVFLSLEAFAKRLSHLGLEVFCVGQVTEPAIAAGDLLIVGSGSGESLIPVAIARKAKALGARVAHLGSNPSSSLSPLADVFVRLPVRTKLRLPDEIDSRQPLTSLFEQCLLLLGDAVAAMIVQRLGLATESLWEHHPNLE